MMRVYEDLDLMMGLFHAPVQRDALYQEENIKEGRRMMSQRLLVVDDEPKIRTSYQRVFSKKGFEVLTAANAMEAKDLLVKQEVAIVFLDINMAEVDGGTLFELIRDFHPSVKVIVTSVYSIEEQKERVRNADAYFDKSDDKEALFEMVAILSRGGARKRF